MVYELGQPSHSQSGGLAMPNFTNLANSYAVNVFVNSIWASQQIVDSLHQQSHEVGRALHGMCSPTLREVPNAKIRSSTG